MLGNHAHSAERLQATRELLDGIVQVLRDEANEAEPAVYYKLVFLMVDVMEARQAL